MYGFPETTAYVIMLKIIADIMQRNCFSQNVSEALGGPFAPMCR